MRKGTRVSYLDVATSQTLPVAEIVKDSILINHGEVMFHRSKGVIDTFILNHEGLKTLGS